MGRGTLHIHLMKLLKTVIISVALSTVLLADDAKSPPVAPLVDPIVGLELREDRQMADFEKLYPGNSSKPTSLGIRDLKAMVHRLGIYENDSISDAFKLTGGRSVRSIPSSELAAHLDIVKSVKKVETLLDEAKDATEARQENVARLRLAAASKEFAAIRKLITEKRKKRDAHTPKSKTETKPQSDPKAKKPDGDKGDKAAKPKKA